jgi:hypothetical protein
MDNSSDLSNLHSSAALQSGHEAGRKDRRGQDAAASRPAATAQPGSGVQVSAFPFDWNDVDYETIHLVVAARAVQISDNCTMGYFYLNPQVTVYSPGPSIAFLKKARKCQAAWCRRFAKTIGAAAFRRQARNCDNFCSRQLAYHGIMVVHGKWVAPHDWKRILQW